MNENTKKYLYVYGDLDYQIRDRIDVLKKALEDVRNTLGEICEDEIECGHVETGKDWLDYHKKIQQGKRRDGRIVENGSVWKTKRLHGRIMESSRH